MAKTNMQIVAEECLLHGIIEKVDTFDGWRRNGYQVQRGSKALFQTMIWKPCKMRKTDPESEARTKLYLVKASFFGKSQVKAL